MSSSTGRILRTWLLLTVLICVGMYVTKLRNDGITWSNVLVVVIVMSVAALAYGIHQERRR